MGCSINIPVKIFIIYICISLFVEIIGFYLIKISFQYHLKVILYNLYILIEVILVLYYFKQILVENIFQSNFYWILFFLFLGNLGLIITKILLQNQAFLLSLFLFFTLSILYLRQLLNKDEAILENPHFWIVTGLLFFNSSFFFLTSFIKYISFINNELATKLYSINHILNIIYYSLVTYGFICQRRLARSSS